MARSRYPGWRGVGVEQLNEQLWRETGQFLNDQGAWTWWATLTFKRRVSDVAAARAFRDWCRTIARETRRHVRVAFAWELQSRGVPAYHALLAIPEDEPWGFNAKTGGAMWRSVHSSAGFTRIERFDPAKGAAWYEGGHENWDVNVACPRPSVCRRKKGCRWAPGPW